MKTYPAFNQIALFILFTCMTYAQSSGTISGKVTDENGEALYGVNIIVKGKLTGTTTDIDGNFSLRTITPLPVTLVASYVGFQTVETEVSDYSTQVLIQMNEAAVLGQEVVVSASRIEERIIESPVSIEKMDILSVQNTSADNYYKGIANLKGVDVATSSINFQIINTRGFASTGNTRFVQLIDGMDTQAPALNFPIGNLNGPSELDVESVELIPGASSALYGPNAFNGILLINSKNPFEYQGLSAFAKTGMNHIGSVYAPTSPTWEGAIRYAKSYNDKFAFKVNLAASRALDWHGTDATDREAGRTPDGFSFNPGADRLHFMGDEASINMAIFPFSSSWAALARGNYTFQPGLSALTYANASALPNHVVSVTPYREEDLIDYNAENYKANVGLFYRLNDETELSYLFNGGWGTSIYTGAQRYSLNNFSIQQHRLQLRSTNFYLRAYATLENSGDSYITEFLAKRINDVAVSRANPAFSDVSGYLATYAAEYIRYFYDQGFAPGDPRINETSNQIAAHQFARGVVDDLFIYDLNTPEGLAAFNSAREIAQEGVVPNGPRFDDQTNLFHAEGQYDFSEEIKSFDLQVGGSYRLFDLNSNGTIFDDGDQNITIQEYGIYAQGAKMLPNDKTKFSGSLRYDKNENFKGRFNPRVSVTHKVKDKHVIRGSFQTGFRIPTTQGQHIDLNIISARLLGGLPRYAEKYDLVRTSSTGVPLAFTDESVLAFRESVFATGDVNAAAALLDPVTELNPVRPEVVQNFEIGYRGVFDNRLYIDLAYYYNIFNDFITQVRVVTAEEGDMGNPNYLTLLNGEAHNLVNGVVEGNTSQIYTNYTGQITSQGFAGGITYSFDRGYTLDANYNWNVLNDAPEDFFAEFNTPEHKTNISFSNREVFDNFGFNVTYRWQSEFEWQSSFVLPANGTVPAYQTIDAQVSYRIPGLKSVIKIGGSNILNEYYIQSLGGPNIGALYYISLTFDEMMR